MFVPPKESVLVKIEDIPVLRVVPSRVFVNLPVKRNCSKPLPPSPFVVIYDISM